MSRAGWNLGQSCSVSQPERHEWFSPDHSVAIEKHLTVSVGRDFLSPQPDGADGSCTLKTALEDAPAGPTGMGRPETIAIRPWWAIYGHSLTPSHRRSKVGSARRADISGSRWPVFRLVVICLFGQRIGQMRCDDA